MALYPPSPAEAPEKAALRLPLRGAIGAFLQKNHSEEWSAECLKNHTESNLKEVTDVQTAEKVKQTKISTSISEKIDTKHHINNILLSIQNKSLTITEHD